MSEKMSSVDFEPQYSEKISRLFIFRGLWGFIFIPWMIIWSIWIGAVQFLMFWYMLFLGKRQEWLWEQDVIFFRTATKWNSYFKAITDERPLFICEK